ncbi:MAG: hypothetical protein H0X37_02540 [Herpetosiphonaceae bacterium]|nr:hypothetical protein [Herpetosiphonaceae bacterium]
MNMTIQRRSLLFIACLLPVLAFNLVTVHASAAATLCFAETKQCLSGRFLSYWQHNGGLPVFGFPITAVQNERNRDTGVSYLTQWFERTRFELHPEQAAPYDVLLGRLGNDRLIQQENGWLMDRHAEGAEANCLWFPQTKHNVCDQTQGSGFQTYWLGHGLADAQLDTFGRSVALFGYPLTDAIEMTNAAGDRVLSQVFERARFEYHLEKSAPFKVLLGLLGSEVRGNPGGAWKMARRLIPSNIPLYRPMQIPTRFDQGPLLDEARVDSQSPNGGDYTVTYSSKQNESLVFILGVGAGAEGNTPLAPSTSELLMVHGVQGTLIMMDIDPHFFSVSWQEQGRSYEFKAQGQQLTREEVIRIAQSLASVN